MKLLPLLQEILTKCKGATSLNVHFSTILCNIINRLDASTAHIFKTDSVWTVITDLLANHHTVVLIEENRNSCPAEIACSQVLFTPFLNRSDFIFISLMLYLCALLPLGDSRTVGSITKASGPNPAKTTDFINFCWNRCRKSVSFIGCREMCEAVVN